MSGARPSRCAARFAVAIAGVRWISGDCEIRHVLTIVDAADAVTPDDAKEVVQARFEKHYPDYKVEICECEEIRHA